MIAEYSLSGVFFSGVLASGVVAYAAALALRGLLARVNVYRWVWHPALFDLATFVILWALVANLQPAIGPGTSASARGAGIAVARAATSDRSP